MPFAVAVNVTEVAPHPPHATPTTPRPPQIMDAGVRNMEEKGRF